MSTSLALTEAPVQPKAPTRNPAVEHCCQARQAAIEQAVTLGLEKHKVKDAGEDAYLKAMPNFLDYESIRDFIACVAYGMINGAIHPIEAPKYFYAAQVATGALRSAPKRPKSAEAPVNPAPEPKS
jgi:hypothetical protein